MQTAQTLPLPGFYNPANAENWDFRPDVAMLRDEAEKWRKQHQIKGAGTDKFNLVALGIDLEKDFCFPDGTLYVGGRSGLGAIEDNKRFAEWIYRNLSLITNIHMTLDAHREFQIFFTPFWQDSDGNPITANRVITVEQIKTGEVKINPAVPYAVGVRDYSWCTKQAIHYCEELERQGKYDLLIWPFHCMFGSDGGALAGVIEEAQRFHNLVRGAQSGYEVKGLNPWTENYSVFSPEVLTRWDGKGSLATRNVKFLETLANADAVAIGGQAASHCVKSSIEDLLDDLKAKDPELVKKVYIMEDCMSPVAIPDGNGGFVLDCTDDAEKALARFKDEGMHVVKSTDPIESWPDIQI